MVVPPSSSHSSDLEGSYYVPGTFPNNKRGKAANRAPTRPGRDDDDEAEFLSGPRSNVSTSLSVVGMVFVTLATVMVMYISNDSGSGPPRSATSSSSSSSSSHALPLSLELAMKSYQPARSASRSSYQATNASGTATSASRPNIVFILTDDQGVGDMDIAGGDFEGLMPNIRRLNEAGWNLTNYYSASLCTPARSSLMTGRYAVTTGMGHGVVMATQPWGLPLSEVLMPELLNRAGYTTHHVGKWHLGHYSKAHLPTARGFNDSLGYYGGYQHPETYFYEWPGCSNSSGCIPVWA